MTNGVTDNIVWIEGTRMYWLNTRLGPEKRKKHQNMYLLYILYVIYIVYILYAYYILYIAYICIVKSVWYINRTSFTTLIG